MKVSLARWLCCGLGLLGGVSARAADLKVEEQTQRLKLDVFSEGTFLKGSRVNLTGLGFGSGARYSVYDRWQVGLKMGQALTYDGGPVALYTSFTSQVTYALMGSFITQQRAVYIDGRPLVRTESARRGLLTVGAGFEQFLFNGTQFAVPSTGLSVHLGYQFPLWGFDWYASGRIGGLVLNKGIVVPVIGNLGPVWTF